MNAEIVIVALIVAIAILGILVIRMELKLRGILRGKRGADLEELIVGAAGDLKKLERAHAAIAERVEDLDARVRKRARRIGLVRFNPFRGTGDGGNQSFAAAFLNEEGDGIVLSTLHARQHLSVFAKPIKNRGSEFELSQEEREALTRAEAA